MNSTPEQASQEASNLTRRGFIGASAAAGSAALMLPSAAQAAGTSLEGYTNWPSVVAGGTLDFFLRDPQAVGSGTTVYPITFTRTAPSDLFMFSTTVAIGNPGVPADASANGCRWTRNYRLSVPANWPSGLYYAYIGSGANACTVPFVVRPATPTAGVKTLVCIPVLTAHAYNPYGGKSIYEYNSSNGVRGSQVSLDRPFAESFNSSFEPWSRALVRWLAKNNVAVDFCTDVDIEATPGVLTGYQLYVQAGHDEYWSGARRTTMDNFVANGGNAAYLGGNTAWWQSRMAAGNGVANRVLVCYKDAALDPIADPAQKTINFISLPTPRPENQTTGSGFVTGCSWTGAQPRPNTPSIVMRPEHWAFAGTGLGQGVGFGGAYVGYECDSAMFVKGSDSRSYPTGVDGTPATLRILAEADGSNWNALSLAAGGSGEQSGYAHITVFSRGGSAGTVFSTGSSDWSYGLLPELDGQTATPISRITLNVINKLRVAYSETADVRQFRKAVSGAVTNNYYSTGTTAPTGSGMVLDGYAFRAFVLPVSGSVAVYRYRSTTAGANGTRYRYSRLTSLDPSGQSWVLEATAFNAYAIAVANSSAVYEHYIFNSATQEISFLYSTLATPPTGWSAGPVVFYAPNDGVAVAQTPGFSLALAGGATSVSVTQGLSVLSDAITVNAVGGFAGAVSFSVSGLPAGVTASFQPATSGTSTKIALVSQRTALPGSYLITITGTAAGAAAATLSLRLVVVAAPAFTLAISQNSLRLPFFGRLGDNVRLSVVGSNGFASAVNFSVSGLPAGLTATFLPSSSTTGTSLYLVAGLLSLAAPGNYTLTITGTSGTQSDTVDLALTVAALL